MKKLPVIGFIICLMSISAEGSYKRSRPLDLRKENTNKKISYDKREIIKEKNEEIIKEKNEEIIKVKVAECFLKDLIEYVENSNKSTREKIEELKKTKIIEQASNEELEGLGMLNSIFNSIEDFNFCRGNSCVRGQLHLTDNKIEKIQQKRVKKKSDMDWFKYVPETRKKSEKKTTDVRKIDIAAMNEELEMIEATNSISDSMENSRK